MRHTGRFVLQTSVALLLGHIGGGFMAGQPPFAHLKGKVVDESGRPIPAARIRYQRLPRQAKDSHGRWIDVPGEAHAGAHVPSDNGGAYDAPNLPAGSYILCADAAGYLASCDWSAWHRLTLTAGQLLDLGNITLVKAATVTIRVDDPLYLVPSKANDIPALAIGVMDQANQFHSASQVLADASGRTFQVGVPYARPMRLWAHSWKYRFTDGSGAPLNSFGTLIPFQVALNGPAPSFTIRLTGMVN